MKSLFPGYYTPSEGDFKSIWSDAIFSFDANVLLNFYKFSPATRELFFNILNDLQGRIWLPHQSAYEYHKHILDRIYDQVALSTASEILGNLDKLNSLAQQFKHHPILKYDSVVEIIRNAQDSMRALVAAPVAVDSYKRDCDAIKNRLSIIFDGLVGSAYDDDELKRKYSLLRERYDKKIPPGFEDVGKPEPERYGDGILWFQLLEHAEKIRKPMIFVTDDKKDDWWLRKHGKDFGPRPELLNEFYKRVGCNLYVYKSEQFIHFAKDFTRITDSEALVELAAQELSDMSSVNAFSLKETGKFSPLDYSGLVNCPECHTKSLNISDGVLACVNCEYLTFDATEALAENIVRIPISRPQSYLEAGLIDGCCGNKLLSITASDRRQKPYERHKICFDCGKFTIEPL